MLLNLEISKMFLTISSDSSDVLQLFSDVTQRVSIDKNVLYNIIVWAAFKEKEELDL